LALSAASISIGFDLVKLCDWQQGAKLNGLDPEAYLRHVIEQHRRNRRNDRFIVVYNDS